MPVHIAGEHTHELVAVGINEDVARCCCAADSGPAGTSVGAALPQVVQYAKPIGISQSGCDRGERLTFDGAAADADSAGGGVVDVGY